MTSLATDVLVVDDRLTVRRGIELLLVQAGFSVAGCAAGSADARELMDGRRHDVVLAEPFLADGGGMEVAAELVAAQRPLVLFADAASPRLRAAAELGAPGFVLEDSPPQMLWEALHVVADGGRWIDPRLRGTLERDGTLLGQLSAREKEILGMLAEGWSGAEVATRLFLSSETVRTHIRNAATKLQARTRAQAVAMYVRAFG